MVDQWRWSGDVEAVHPDPKTKKKPLVPVASEPEPLMSPYVLEVSGGSDIVATVMQFCNHRKTGLCVLFGWGSVANVTFRQPTTHVIFRGRFNLLSISVIILPPSSPVSTNSDFVGKFVCRLATQSTTMEENHEDGIRNSGPGDGAQLQLTTAELLWYGCRQHMGTDTTASSATCIALLEDA
ncbi:hypothetical protein L1987_70018 [Smallanthus sonchifolius]|uniref:Uncharacterized protein n=1 Tax=Smallanthus sonchifolius TaxID=185202 RepID=A0ACB9B8D3_9ASTR|nr:hypothetical protein L1987_70018 [Smallanthus sonchifolius]